MLKDAVALLKLKLKIIGQEIGEKTRFSTSSKGCVTMCGKDFRMLCEI